MFYSSRLVLARVILVLAISEIQFFVVLFCQLEEKELKAQMLEQKFTDVSKEKESEVQKLHQELTREQDVSRLAHDDLLVAKMRERESQHLVVKLKEQVCEHSSRGSLPACL